MRKVIFLLLTAMIFCLSGCAAELPEGYQLVKSAKAKYETLDSGRVIMVDLDKDEKIMEFSFLINPNDEMVLSYYGKDGDKEMYAYSDGAEYFYKDAGDEMWSVISSSDESYIYNIYNRENRYPYADGGIFFLDGGSVETVSVTENADGSCTVTYVYDADKLNNSTQGLLEDVQSFESLTTVFEINADGFITDFTETGTVTDSGGVKMDINMRITIDMMNEVYEIPYPVDQVKKS